MKDLYLVRRDVLDRIHQNPNALPVVYPETLGDILMEADVPALLAAATAELGLTELDATAQGRIKTQDKTAVMAEVKARRDLIGYLDKRGYDNADPGSRASWELLWRGMRAWDNRAWNWQEIAAGLALASLFCPAVEEREPMVLSRGSTAH